MYFYGCVKGRCKHMQAWQPPQQQRAPPQPGSGYHGVEYQHAQWGEEQRWPPPLQPSESYPEYPLYLTEKTQRACINYNKRAIWSMPHEAEQNSLTGWFSHWAISKSKHSWSETLWSHSCQKMTQCIKIWHRFTTKSWLLVLWGLFCCWWNILVF